MIYGDKIFSPIINQDDNEEEWPVEESTKEPEYEEWPADESTKGPGDEEELEELE